MTMLDHPSLFAVPDDWWHYRTCPVCGCAMSVTYDHTYVVQRQGWVKIGATNNLRRRLNELARPAWVKHLISPPGMDWLEPLAVLSTFVGGEQEHELHRRFAGAHVLGEWFLPDGAMIAWLSDLPAREDEA